MTKQEFLRLAYRFPVAAALKSDDDIQPALGSDALLLFMLKGDAFQLAPFVTQAHRLGKGILHHLDPVRVRVTDRPAIQSLHPISAHPITTTPSPPVPPALTADIMTI